MAATNPNHPKQSIAQFSHFLAKAILTPSLSGQGTPNGAGSPEKIIKYAVF